MDIPAVEDMVMDLLGLRVQLQHEGEWACLTDTAFSEKWRKKISIRLASFSGSLGTQLDAIANVRAEQGAAGGGAPWGGRAGQPGYWGQLQTWALGWGQAET